MTTEMHQESLIVDVETKSLRSCIEIGAVDKERDALIWIEIHLRTYETNMSI